MSKTFRVILKTCLRLIVQNQYCQGIMKVLWVWFLVNNFWWENQTFVIPTIQYYHTVWYIVTETNHPSTTPSSIMHLSQLWYKYITVQCKTKPTVTQTQHKYITVHYKTIIYVSIHLTTNYLDLLWGETGTLVIGKLSKLSLSLFID